MALIGHGDIFYNDQIFQKESKMPEKGIEQLRIIEQEVEQIITEHNTAESRIEHTLDKISEMMMFWGLGYAPFERLVNYYKTINEKNAEFYENDLWLDHASPSWQEFGHAKMCYYISSAHSELPIRNHPKKLEPDYARRTYNQHRSCNQPSIKRVNERGISYIVFYTKYRGKNKKFKGRYFITGLFPIDQTRWIDGRLALKSEDPVFLGIEDALEITEERWRIWFGKPMPKDKNGAFNMRYMNRFLEQGSKAFMAIMAHFELRCDNNRIEEYIEETG